MPETLLITGATGNTGAAILRLLEKRKVAVRAMVHKKGDVSRLKGSSVEVVVGDFDNMTGLWAALEGIHTAYLVTPSSIDAEAKQIRFVELAAEAGVRHIVKLSQFGADETSPVRFLRYHATVERRIRDSGMTYTFLRPNLFFQSLLAFRQWIVDTGHFFAPIGEARVSAIDVRDIAAVAALALTESGHHGKTYTLTGLKAVTHAEMAVALARATGRAVRFVESSPGDFAAAAKQAGMPAWQADGLIELYASYRHGEASEVLDTVQRITGHEPLVLGQFASEYADTFRATVESVR